MTSSSKLCVTIDSSELNTLDDGQNIARNLETDIKVEERHAIDTLRIVVVLRTGVSCQRGLQHGQVGG